MRRFPTSSGNAGWAERDPFAIDLPAEWIDDGPGDPFEDAFANLQARRGSPRRPEHPADSRHLFDGAVALADLAPPARLDPEETPPPTPVRPVWIRIELVDAAGRALPNHPYRLRLSDGSVRTGVFDETGALRFDDVTPGLCTLLLPTEHELEWAPPTDA
ncbi:MAG: hypothetical protein IAG13_32075 [Deltaproteobacteria bacterium]|nr:hypothetical protein [Nannocystaceae bacterium]